MGADQLTEPENEVDLAAAAAYGTACGKPDIFRK